MNNSEMYKHEREAMVRDQIQSRGIDDRRVLQAMLEVPRDQFVQLRQRTLAYVDSPLPIESGQTISQPYIVALMTAALELEPEDRVLEIGTGSGYAAAVLSLLCDSVYTIERIDALAQHADKTLQRLGYENVQVITGDGSIGWPQAAPYDAIVVTAGGPRIPDALKTQLAIGGRLVMPVGDLERYQSLVRLTRTSQTDYLTDDLGGVRFVPLIGEEAWPQRGVHHPLDPEHKHEPQ